MAVEFAMVLFPLCILIFFVLENALVFWVTSALDNGLDASMRQFYVQSGASAHVAARRHAQRVCRQVDPFVPLREPEDRYRRLRQLHPDRPDQPHRRRPRGPGGRISAIQHGCLTKGSVVVVQAAFAQHTFQNFGVVKNQFQDGSWLINRHRPSLDGNATGSTGC